MNAIALNGTLDEIYKLKRQYQRFPILFRSSLDSLDKTLSASKFTVKLVWKYAYCVRFLSKVSPFG